MTSTDPASDAVAGAELLAAGERPRFSLRPSVMTGGERFFPLFVLFWLNWVDELDDAAYNVLLPNIRDHFRLSSAGILALTAIIAPFATGIGLLVGFFGDRLRRTPVVVAGAATWGSFSLLTGLAPNIGTLGVARAGARMGKVVNGPMHQSLIADLYPPVARPSVFAVYNAGNPIGRIVGPIGAGLIAAAFTWRTPFMVFAALTASGVAMALLLKEPLRGRFDRLAAGADETLAGVDARPPSFGESWRLLYTVGTIRRLYFAIPLLAASFTGIGSMLSLYYERVHGVDETTRGFLFAAEEPFTLLGLAVGTPILSRLIARDPGSGLRVLKYMSFVTAGFIVLIAISPTWQLALASSMGRAAAGAALSPAIAATLSLVMPPRARSLGFAVFGLWFLPSLLFLPIFGLIGDVLGFRAAVLALAALYLVGMQVLSTASTSVKSDIANNHRHTLMESAAQVERIRFREAAERGDIDESAFALLEARNIHVSYGALKVLFGIDMSFNRGEKVALLGTNGAGKSTFLKVVSGLITPDVGTGGTIWFKNEDITFTTPAERVRLGMVQVGGGRATFPSLTVEENLRIGGYLFMDDKTLVRERVEEVFELFPALQRRARQRAGTLSGGEQQMMALGRAFIAKPDLLMIDELALGLAPIVMQEIVHIVEEVVSRGTTLILVEQSLNVALSMTERAYFLEKGEVRFSGPTSELIERDDIVRSVFFGSRPESVG